MNDIISEILRLEYPITLATIRGHKANDGDQYATNREVLKYLREKYKQTGCQ
jgi:hypothetical protein